MKKYLFLVCLCLVPFVVFSSTSFTSQNPIELPASGDDVIRSVVDVRGNPLDPRSSYRIVSVFWGALGGDVYLGPSPNSTASCDNGIFRYNSDLSPPGTPVRFIGVFPLSRGVLENTDINFRFTIPPVETNCIDYTIWKVGDYDASLGASLLETGGTVSREGGWFRIVQSVKPPALGYNLFYCPGPFLPLDQCREVSVVGQDGKRRLALVNDHSQAASLPLPLGFEKV